MNMESNVKEKLTSKKNEAIITDLGREGELINLALEALNNNSFGTVFKKILGIREVLCLKGLLEAYVYWSKKEGTAFRSIEPFGYGFPHTLEESAREMSSSGLKETMRVINRLMSIGLFKKSLQKSIVNDFKVTYYFLNVKAIIGLMIRCNEIILERGEDTKQLKKDIVEAEENLASAQLRLKEFREETINIILMQDIDESLPIKEL